MKVEGNRLNKFQDILNFLKIATSKNFNCNKSHLSFRDVQLQFQVLSKVSA